MSPLPASRTTGTSFFLIAQPGELTPLERDRETNLSSVLDSLRGEVGITGLSVWGAAPPVAWFRSQDDNSRLVHTEGGLFFEPLRRSGGCRPPVRSPDFTSTLAAVAQSCAQSEFSLRLRLALATLGGLATHYPEFAARSAFDDPSRVAVCLLNPAVQECMISIAGAVPPQFGVAQIVLHDFEVGWLEAFDARIQWPAPLGPIERSALAVCFCSSCMKNAREVGVDADDAKRRVQTFVLHAFSQAAEFGGAAAGLLAEQPVLQAYTALQSDFLDSLLARIVAESRADVLLSREALAPAALGLAVDVSKPAGVVTKIAALNQLSVAGVRESRHSEVTLPPSVLVGAKSGEFVSAMSRLAECGLSGVEIDGFGGISESARTTLKQGIRFARRSTGL